MYPDVYCTEGDTCLMTTGEGEVNATLSTAALIQSSKFDASKMYWGIAGITSINAKHETLRSVTFGRYSIQFGLWYELDTRQMPVYFSLGFIPQGAVYRSEGPQFWFSTEVFELNDELRKMVAKFVAKANSADDDEAIVYSSHYQTRTNEYAAGASLPGVELCDGITLDTWYSGSMIGKAIEEYVDRVARGDGKYCTAIQEDSAVLAALLRGAVTKKADFGSVVVMQVGSDFDREYWGQEALDGLFASGKGKMAGLKNLGIAGEKVVKRILRDWKAFEGGVEARDYVGDVFGALGGMSDFRPKK